MRDGLVSISFRKLTVEEIVSLIQKAGLSAVEWGGDVHVPPEDIAAAENARGLCEKNGILISSYGTYFRLGQSGEEYEKCVTQARRLGTDVIRIWAGNSGSLETDAKTRKEMVAELKGLSKFGMERGVRTALEYHPNTLTDCRASVQRLLCETEDASDRLFFYWQPRWDWSEEERLASLTDLGNRLLHTHVFAWQADYTRLPLAKGEAMWKRALPRMNRDACALLEFVADDDPKNLLKDAATLQKWLQNA